MLEIKKRTRQRESGLRDRPVGKMRRVLRIVRRVFLVGVLIGSITGTALLIYVLATGKGLGEPSTNTTYIKRTPQAAPTVPTAAAEMKVTLERFDARVSPGQQALLMIKTTPGADCTIKVEYGKERTLAASSGLVPQRTDEHGAATWTWTVQQNMPNGEWPTTVMCATQTGSDKVVKDLIVSKYVRGMHN